MARTTSARFQRKLEEFQDIAAREPVEIMRRGRGPLVLLAAGTYRRLLKRTQRAYSAGELPTDLLGAVAKARMSRKRAALNRLLNR